MVFTSRPAKTVKKLEEAYSSIRDIISVEGNHVPI